jgi:hypothetical protein
MMRSMGARHAAFLVGLAAGLALPLAAAGSVAVTTGSFSGARLAVDRNDLAEVTWRQDSAQQALFLPPTGQVYHGGSLAGADISRPAKVALSNALAVRRTPDGSFWALQRWQLPGQPPELHLAHWTGAATVLTLTQSGQKLAGTVAFHGKPVTGFSSTPAGKQVRIYVFLDCFACGGSTGWTQMLGVKPASDGSFALTLRPTWAGKRYRAEVEGPNVGASRAPDAQVVIDASSS